MAKEQAATSTPELNNLSTRDAFACKVLRIRQPRTSKVDEENAQALFSYSMVLSGLRCILSYVIVPFVFPAIGLGATATLGPAIGIPVGILAIAFDIKGMRRFFTVQYKYRWQMAWIYLSVIALVTYLVLKDLFSLFSL